VLLGLAGWLSQLQIQNAEADERAQLVTGAQAIAAGIDPGQARRLTFTYADVTTEAFNDIRYQMISFESTLPGVAIFSVGERDRRLYFGPGIYRRDRPMSWPAGTPFDSTWPPPAPFHPFKDARSFRVVPPSGGEYFLAQAPVLDPETGAVLLTVGLISPKDEWTQRLTRILFKTLGTALLLYLIALLCVLGIRWYSGKEGAHDHWVVKWSPGLLLALGLSITIYLGLDLKDEAEAAATAKFYAACQSVESRIADRMKDQEQLLRAGTAVFTAFPKLTRSDWRIFVQGQSIERQLPGLQGVGFSLLIRPADLAAHTASVRSEGFPTYAVSPPGNREVYTSIVYLEPFSGRNLRAFGFDMYTEPVRRTAMERARDTGEPALSGKVVLVQETNTDVQPGALMYAPVYRRGQPVDTVEQRRAALFGWVYSPYRMRDLMQGTLAPGTLDPRTSFRLVLFDGEGPDSRALLYDSDATKPPPQPGSGLALEVPMVSSGRLWTLRFTARDSSELADLTKAWLMFAFGTGVSLLLAGLWASLLGARSRAQRLAANLTLEVREREQRVRLLLDSTAEGIYGIDLDGLCTFANAACLRLLGYSSLDELLGKNMHWLIHNRHADGSHFPVEECRIFQAFTRRENAHVDDEVFWRADGTSFPAEYWSYTEGDDGRVLGAVVSFLDVSERKAAERENQDLNRLLQRTQKLESVGVLAGGLGHDFNNLLAGMAGHIELAKLNLTQKKFDEAAVRLGKVDAVFARAKALSHQLLTFAKGGAPVKRREDLVPLIREWVEFAFSGSEILPEVDVAPNLWQCDCDSQQISQALENLLINAKQVTPPGGKIQIRAFNLDSEPLRVRLEVIDHGPGISPEILDKIFDPFFTTKASGSGLGLAIAYSIARRHGGVMHVDTELGKGSTFALELPALADREASLAPEAEAAYTGSGVALVMDDEEALRDTVGGMLESFGFEVLVAKEGGEALALHAAAEAAGKPVSLVLLDLTVPGAMGGWETARRLKSGGSGAVVLVMSGYSQEGSSDEPRSNDVQGRLAKPFLRKELAQMLRRVIPPGGTPEA